MSFDSFDWPYNIEHISITPGYTDQNGDYVPPVTVSNTIQGHVSDITLKQLQRLPEGVYAPGDRRLVVDKSHGIKVGDEIRITESDSTVTKWHVQEKEKSYSIAGKYSGQERESFLLIRK
jgi:hypothetical protein